MKRPPPLRTDGSNAFARHSMQERVPRIARDVLQRNPDYPPFARRAIEQLACDIEQNAPLPTPKGPSADIADWVKAHEDHAGETWLATEWFHAELAFYRELVRACRFWETSRDPFTPAKDEELAGEAPWLRLEAALAPLHGGREYRLASLLEACLWGNRVDLSYAVATSNATQADSDDLLVDERAAAVPLLARHDARVHIVADNTGTELALDFALAGAVLEQPKACVTIHLKMQPMFVSDAMPVDAWRLLDRMRGWGRNLHALANRLDESFAEGRLEFIPDPFWNGPRFLWETPPHLDKALSSATIVVLKGDANYRRLVGDALWPPETPLAEACAYLRAPLVCLRTMKSDPVVGLPKGLADRLDATHARWRVDGKRGVLQTFVP